MTDFFKVYRKKGFEESLHVLYNSKNREYRESEFYKTLKDRKIHLNEFYRSKDDLLKYKLIAYKLDEEYEKIIFLTDKGAELYKMILELDKILVENIDSKSEENKKKTKERKKDKKSSEVKTEIKEKVEGNELTNAEQIPTPQ